MRLLYGVEAIYYNTDSAVRDHSGGKLYRVRIK
jgi:hypothetical protein